MKALIVSMNCAPELTGVGKYVGEMAAWLVAQGWQVRVITAPPYYPAWRIGDGYSGWRYRVDRLGGAVVYRCPLYVPARPTGVLRLAHLASFAASSLPVCLWQAATWRPDIVFAVEPPLLCAPAAWAAARIAGARAWLHVQDFEVDAAFDLGLLRSARMRGIATRIEAALMRCFDRVSTISQRMLARLEQKQVAEPRRYLFPNWVDTNEIRPATATAQLRQELGLADGRQVLLYSGNLGRKQGLEVVVEAARALQGDARLLFVICGDGPERASLERLAAGLPNVAFRSLQPRERLSELLSMASVHLLPQRSDVEDLVLPSKLSAMMSSGRPVLATARAGSELARVAAHGGLVVPPGDVEAFARAVTALADDPDRCRALGACGREFAVRMWDTSSVLARAFSPESLGAL